MKKLEEEIHALFISRGLTLSVAESCTGGSVAARLTQIPGASRYFLGGVVAYSNEMKMKALGVTASSLEHDGAVSQEVVAQMAEGVLKLTNSDFSLAVSGIAGPEGGTPEKPVGTVWCAMANKNKPTQTWRLHLTGSRAEIITSSCDNLLQKLLQNVT